MYETWLVLISLKIFHAKVQSAQSAAAFLRIAFALFAPLHEIFKRNLKL